jgi:hypothetical protein
MHIPLVLEFNGDHLHDLEAKGMAPQGLQRSLSIALMEGAVSRSAHTVASGKGWHEQFIRRYRVSAERVSTVENGTPWLTCCDREDLRAFSPSRLRNRTQNCLPGRILSLAWCRNLAAGIARAAVSWHSRLPGAVGAGVNFEACKQLALDIGNFAADVQFTGQLPSEQYAAVLASADIGVSPYCGWKEFSGMKLFDYKAAGLAIIASGENGQPDTLIHGRPAGLSPCDEDALFESWCSLHRTMKSAAGSGQAARLKMPKSTTAGAIPPGS